MSFYYIKQDGEGSEWAVWKHVSAKEYLESTTPSIAAESLDDAYQKICSVESQKPFLAYDNCFYLNYYPDLGHKEGPTESDFIGRTIFMPMHLLLAIEHDNKLCYIIDTQSKTLYYGKSKDYLNIVGFPAGTKTKPTVACTYDPKLAKTLHQKRRQLIAKKQAKAAKKVTQPELYKLTTSLGELIKESGLPFIEANRWSLGVLGAYLLVLAHKKTTKPKVIKTCKPLLDRWNTINESNKERLKQADQTTYTLLENMAAELKAKRSTTVS